MASIQEVSTSSKYLSFKIRVCLGRDERGKQHFKTMKWHPPEGMTPAKARKEVQRVAAVWEAEQLASADLQEVKVEESTISYTFGRFVDEVWIPLCVRDGSHRPSTVAMYTNILKVMRPHFEEQPLAEITGIQISKYLTCCGMTIEPISASLLRTSPSNIITTFSLSSSVMQRNKT